jgi:hypothetical protein
MHNMNKASANMRFSAMLADEHRPVRVSSEGRAGRTTQTNVIYIHLH